MLLTEIVKRRETTLGVRLPRAFGGKWPQVPVPALALLLRFLIGP